MASKLSKEHATKLLRDQLIKWYLTELEFNARTGDPVQAMVWFSNVIDTASIDEYEVIVHRLQTLMSDFADGSTFDAVEAMLGIFVDTE